MHKFLSSLAALLFAFGASAQPIAPDSEFRVGRLENGLTYYLAHNELPAGCADFYIAHNVGALQEEDNQNGLAHFLEHMAFNGTRHYPGKGILEFLAKDGVRFGYNVNAYTTRNETVYNLSSVPLVRESFVDSVLTVLHDWSCDISCEQQALDDERGVISEEWRLRDDSRTRINNLQNALIYKGSKHPERTVIGSYEVINGFKREEILDFYHKWYRPDLQAIIVVGDFDVDEMEARVRAKFSDIPKAVNPAQKERYLPAKRSLPLIEDMADEHLKIGVVKFIFKQPYPGGAERITEEYIRDAFSRQIVSAVLTERLRRLTQQRDCPARSAVLVTNEYEPDYYISLFTVTPKSKDRVAESMEMTAREIRRLVLFGISPDEFEAAKLSVAQRFHLDRELSRDEVKSEELVKAAVEHFLRNHPLLGPVGLQEVQNKVLAAISWESVRDYPASMFLDSEAIYSTCYNPVENPGFAPSADAVRGILASVEAEPLQAQYLSYPKLDFDVDVAPGRIVKRTADKRLGGYEEWLLSNGAKVYYRQAAPVKANVHLATVWRFDTGYRSYPAEGLTAARFAAAYNNRTFGFRGFERQALRSFPELSGVSILTRTLQQAASVELSAARGREEAAFKAGWLLLQEPYFGDENGLEKTKADNLKNLGRKPNPRTVFEEKYTRQVYGDHPWLQPFDSAAIEAVDMALLREVYEREFTDFAQLSVFITSDLDRADIEAYVCRYVASLQGEYPYGKTATALPKPVLKGRQLITETNAPESEPVSNVDYMYVADVKTTARSILVSDFLDYILSARYLNLIREERGGTYHVGFSTDVPDNPAQPWRGVVDFQTRPEMTQLLVGDVRDVMEAMAKDGPTAEEMDQAGKYIRKRHGELERRAASSLPEQNDRLVKTVLWGRDFDADYDALLRGIRARDVRDLARKFLAGDHIVEIYTEE
ncbi:MAG: insulinase family protein [Bacteroidales bacterium]|nr:insulinase family protein [Bacteroidales bacterium]